MDIFVAFTAFNCDYSLLPLLLLLCSYELVRQLQFLISSHLSPMVTRRVGGARLERENFHYTAAVITEDVLESNQYDTTVHMLMKHNLTLLDAGINRSVNHLPQLSRRLCKNWSVICWLSS